MIQRIRIKSYKKFFFCLLYDCKYIANNYNMQQFELLFFSFYFYLFSFADKENKYR